MKTLAGSLLIAVPELPDTNFFRTVVFLCEHSEDGAMGVILNRPANTRLPELWRKLDSSIKVDRDQPVFVGGPVRGPLMALHDRPELSDSDVIAGVYMTMASEKLNQMVVDQDCEFKAFSGYSGWAADQLESEIERGGWLVHPAEPGHIFCDSEKLWQQVCESFGSEIMLRDIPGVDLQHDPNLN